MFRSIQFDSKGILAEAEKASAIELLISSVFVIGGFYLVHVLMYGPHANASLGSRGIMFIVGYELLGMFIFLLFRKPFVAFLYGVEEHMPLLLKIPVGFEFMFCCYLLVSNIL